MTALTMTTFAVRVKRCSLYELHARKRDGSGTVMYSAAYPLNQGTTVDLCLLFFSTLTGEDGRWIREMNSDGVFLLAGYSATIHLSGTNFGEWGGA